MWECGRILGGTLVDDGEPGFDGRAVPGVDAAVDGRREDDGAALLKAYEGIAPRGAVRRQARLRDGDEASAFGKTRQRGRDMAHRRVCSAPIDVGKRRERRVQQDDGGSDVDIEVVVDLRRVEAGHSHMREEMTEEAGAGLGQLVQGERGAGEFGEDGEEAGAGRWLEHAVGRRNRGGAGYRKPNGKWRGELLECLALLGAPGVAGQQARDLCQHRQQGGGRPSAGGHGAAELAQEQDGRGLAGFVGALPVPAALGIRCADGLLHRGAQHRGIDQAAMFEIAGAATGRHRQGRPRGWGLRAQRRGTRQWEPRQRMLLSWGDLGGV